MKGTRPDEGRVSGIELDSWETRLSPSVGSGISHGLRKRNSMERIWRKCRLEEESATRKGESGEEKGRNRRSGGGGGGGEWQTHCMKPR